MPDLRSELEAYIDWNQLGLLSEGNPEFEVELLQLFIEDSWTQLRVLETAIAQGSIGSIERAAHHIKGASANVGAIAIQTIAAQMEHLARQKQLTRQAVLVIELRQQLEVLGQVVPSAHSS